MTIATRGQGVVVDPPDGQTSTQVSFLSCSVSYVQKKLNLHDVFSWIIVIM